MSITDELRRLTKDPLLGYASQDLHIVTLTKIADSIDAEHERACKEQYACGVEHGIGASIEASMIQEHGYIELPKDADGEVIHIGDKVTLYGQRVYEVDAIFFHKDRVSVSYSGESGCGCDNANNFHHYHKPTVEGVLHQFLGECDSAISLGYDEVPHEVFAKYAAKLRLAGGEDA